jgi:hypothetical protein
VVVRHPIDDQHETGVRVFPSRRQEGEPRPSHRVLAPRDLSLQREVSFGRAPIASGHGKTVKNEECKMQNAEPNTGGSGGPASPQSCLAGLWSPFPVPVFAYALYLHPRITGCLVAQGPGSDTLVPRMFRFCVAWLRADGQREAGPRAKCRFTIGVDRPIVLGHRLLGVPGTGYDILVLERLRAAWTSQVKTATPRPHHQQSVSVRTRCGAWCFGNSRVRPPYSSSALVEMAPR